MRARAILPLLAALASPAGMRAQQEIDAVEVAPTRPSPTPAAYASDGRRDPFVPLAGAYASAEHGAPRLEQLDLTGIFQGGPGRSLAVLEDPARRGHFVRIGETLGNARLLEILPEAAVFEVDDYGISRRDTLRLAPERSAPAPEQRAEPPEEEE